MCMLFVALDNLYSSLPYKLETHDNALDESSCLHPGWTLKLSILCYKLLAGKWPYCSPFKQPFSIKGYAVNSGQLSVTKQLYLLSHIWGWREKRTCSKIHFQVDESGPSIAPFLFLSIVKMSFDEIWWPGWEIHSHVPSPSYNLTFWDCAFENMETEFLCFSYEIIKGGEKGAKH